MFAFKNIYIQRLQFKDFSKTVDVQVHSAARSDNVDLLFFNSPNYKIWIKWIHRCFLGFATKYIGSNCGHSHSGFIYVAPPFV